MGTRKLLAAGTLAAVLAVAGCGGDDNSASDKAAGSGSGNKPAKLSGSIDVWIMDPGSPAVQTVVKQYATDFQAAHPGTTVNIQFVPWAQAHDKFTTAIAGGKVPDVAEMGTTWTPEFADQGAFEEVTAASAGDYVGSLVAAGARDRHVCGQPGDRGAPRPVVPQRRHPQAG